MIRSTTSHTWTTGALALLVLLLSACNTSPTRSIGRSLDDASAGNAIKARMLRAPHDYDRVEVTVNDGLVLLAGRVNDPDAKMEAERIAWSAPKVRQVANEVIVEGDRRQLFGAGDSAISAQIRTKIVADRRVRAQAVNIETHNGVVYLMGRTHTAAEADIIARHASTTAGVERVVSYITPLDQPELGY